jgi:hypothetical protein
MKEAAEEVKEAFIISYEIKGKVFIRMFKPDRLGPAIVQGWKSEREALDYYENGYRAANKRGGGWLAGALIMDMQMQPMVHNCTLKEIEALVGPEPHLHTFSGEGVWGQMGLHCPDAATAQAFRLTGKRPNLAGG